MEPYGWVITIVVVAQVICHVANTFLREYFSRLDSVGRLLSFRNRPAEKEDRSDSDGSEVSK